MQHSVFKLTSMEKEAVLKNVFLETFSWPTLGILCNVHVQEIAIVGRSWVMLSPRRRMWTSRQIVAEPLAKWGNEMGMSFQRIYVFWFYNTIWGAERLCHYKFNRVQRRGLERMEVGVMFANLSSFKSLHLSLHAIKSNHRQLPRTFCASHYFLFNNCTFVSYWQLHW